MVISLETSKHCFVLLLLLTLVGVVIILVEVVCFADEKCKINLILADKVDNLYLFLLYEALTMLLVSNYCYCHGYFILTTTDLSYSVRSSSLNTLNLLLLPLFFETLNAFFLSCFHLFSPVIHFGILKSERNIRSMFYFN